MKTAIPISIFLFMISSAIFGAVESAVAQVEVDLGTFTNHQDIGAVKKAGGVAFDSSQGVYEISGGGKNMWFGEDECHFVWKKISGNFVLRSRCEFVGEGVDPHRKMGWMIRTNLETDSPYVDVAVHGDGLTSMQFRPTQGADTEEVGTELKAPDVVQLQRKDGKFTMAVAKYGDPFTNATLENVDLGDEVYVGLFVCSHNEEVVESAQFSDVRIVTPVADDFKPYQDYFASRLEVMDLDSGRRTVVHTTSDSMQAPNWTRDGKALIFNRNGRLYRFELETKKVEEINCDFATSNNNDHVLSFDGKQIGISHHSSDHDGKSMIYTLPVTGGTPKLVTKLGPSYLHGWSPDGKSLIYTGGRDGKYNIYKISTDGGEETQLTAGDWLDDGSEYSPDGKKIYFNSTRNGSMDLWRMNSDGSEPVQLTDDPFNNWFPHISTDGQSVVFLSFGEEVEATDHPFYKHVYLRQMPIDGGQPKVIAYLYGGQGTINVPSFSPDGKRIAFVSNSAEDKNE
jgi:regulation of enolase protein 1 (concanavalin A-like superfamily)